MIIHLRDMHRVGMCSRGVRAFFLRHNLLDWNEFLKSGIEPEKLAATGDAMALQVVESVKNGR